MTRREPQRTQARPMPELGFLSAELCSLYPPPIASLTVEGAGAAAVGAGLAVRARGTDEGLALDGSCSAGTVLGAASGEPGFPCLWKP